MPHQRMPSQSELIERECVCLRERDGRECCVVCCQSIMKSELFLLVEFIYGTEYEHYYFFKGCTWSYFNT